ncbi:hypothetical protein Ait01nite_043470 [Actinoplanes italicus]|uniref:Uncharacterized protein n=2 Tax=Actinoplanes italicus TaxID=113567 RepID=A0A2T0KD30_9ACTN|nr:hypothetical protein CLV67_107103 [Actinoplanes italicus]GIE31302.1 hypothetical protein Ait01nite_043470 [Actinoplanes italicus]
MPIDTRLDGNPAALFSGAQWLRGRLGFEVDNGATTMRLAGHEARHSWVGAGGAAFSERMTAAAGLADRLRAEIEATAATFSDYGQTLATAQARMQAVRSLAGGQGLMVAGTLILDPVAADPATYARLQTAYVLAMSQVAELRTLMASARALAQARQAQVRAVPPIQPTDVVSGSGGAPPPAKPDELRSRAFTTEQSKPAPGPEPAGRNLPAHEQTHVVQQRNGVQAGN